MLSLMLFHMLLLSILGTSLIRQLGLKAFSVLFFPVNDTFWIFKDVQKSVPHQLENSILCMMSEIIVSFLSMSKACSRFYNLPIFFAFLRIFVCHLLWINPKTHFTLFLSFLLRLGWWHRHTALQPFFWFLIERPPQLLIASFTKGFGV